MACTLNDQQLLFTVTGVIQLIDHRCGNEMIAVSVDEKNGHPGMSDMAYRGNSLQIVAAHSLTDFIKDREQQKGRKVYTGLYNMGDLFPAAAVSAV